MFMAEKERVEQTTTIEDKNDSFDTGNQQQPCTEKPIILVVTRHGHLKPSVMDYVLNVANRLNKKLLIAHVNTLPLLNDCGERSRYFATAVEESSALIQTKALETGVTVSSIKETGKIHKVVGRLCRILKRIEFIVIDQKGQMEELISHSPVPVFSIFKDEIMKDTDMKHETNLLCISKKNQ